MIRYLMKIKPPFPVIWTADGYLAGAVNEEELQTTLENYTGKPGTIGNLIDITGKDWSIIPEHGGISPLTGRNRWKKIEIIELFNSSSLAEASALSYSTGSLSAKRLDRIITDIVQLIADANGRQHQMN